MNRLNKYLILIYVRLFVINKHIKLIRHSFRLKSKSQGGMTNNSIHPSVNTFENTCPVIRNK